MPARAWRFKSSPAHMIKLRKFSFDHDLERIIEIEKQSFGEPWPDDYLKKVAREPSNDFIVAEADGKIIGYVLARVKEDKSGSTKTIAIDTEYRKQGIGKTLISAVIEKLKEKGAKQVFLHLRTYNKTATEFYKNLGFETIETKKNYFPNNDDAYLLRKEV